MVITTKQKQYHSCIMKMERKHFYSFWLFNRCKILMLFLIWLETDQQRPVTVSK
jgi:hypothetical protein